MCAQHRVCVLASLHPTYPPCLQLVRRDWKGTSMYEDGIARIRSARFRFSCLVRFHLCSGFFSCQLSSRCGDFRTLRKYTDPSSRPVSRIDACMCVSVTVLWYRPYLRTGRVNCLSGNKMRRSPGINLGLDVLPYRCAPRLQQHANSMQQLASAC